VSSVAIGGAAAGILLPLINDSEKEKKLKIIMETLKVLVPLPVLWLEQCSKEYANHSQLD
jgi:hypothetical protein